MQSPVALAVIYRQILFVSRFHGGRTNTLIASYIPRCTKPARLPARGGPKSDLLVLCSNLPYSFLPKPTVPRPNALPFARPPGTAFPCRQSWSVWTRDL